jgi:hypothetical protein
MEATPGNKMLELWRKVQTMEEKRIWEEKSHQSHSKIKGF